MEVTKRNGIRVPFDAEKVNETIHLCCEGLSGVSASDVAMKAELHLFDGIKTADIQNALIESAYDLTTEEKPNYSIVAGRLLMFDIRKRVYDKYDPDPLLTIIKQNVSTGWYDKDILDKYSEEDINYFDSVIEHERDMDLPYAAALTYEKKYLIKDKNTKEVFETPQVAIMLISMCLFSVEGVENRNKKVVDFYEAVSTQKVSLPTPIMAGVRSPTRQFSSCCLIDADDSLDSINAGGNAIVKYASKRAGIGINGGRIRALGSKIRNGEASHTGVTNFYKKFQADLHSCSQGGLRNSAATLNFPWWHKEAETILVLKNNKGTEDNRVRHMDYVMQLNRLLYKRAKNNEYVSLFSPSDVRELYDLFYQDQDKFEAKYLELEADSSVPRKQVRALDLFSLLAKERSGTGRIYGMNVDHANNSGSFNPNKSLIYMTNLCCEVLLPTKPLDNINDENGEIALCTLAAFNLGNVSVRELPHLSMLLVEALDNLLDYQDYPVKAAEKNKLRRTLGIGVINYAYWLAKNKLKYSDKEALKATHELFEAVQYNLISASNKLAEQKGECAWHSDTKFSQGLLPIDWYNKGVDKLGDFKYNYDWEELRERIGKYGVRNSTLMALMPSETSSLISSATNGIEPPRSAMSIKSGKDGKMKVIVPEYQTLKDYYEFVWDLTDNKHYLSLVAIMQKFVDQSISANTNYDPSWWDNKKVPVQRVLQDMFYAYSVGVKTLYYHNTRDGRGQESEDTDDGCASGACKI